MWNEKLMAENRQANNYTVFTPTVNEIFSLKRTVHCKKKVHEFPVSSRDVTNQTPPVLVVLKNMKKFNFLKSRLKSRLNKQ